MHKKIILYVGLLVCLVYVIFVTDIGRRSHSLTDIPVGLPQELGDLIIVEKPRPFSTITGVGSSSIEISGRARGFWFFEGSFPVHVFSYDDELIGSGIATAEGDWMTTEFVPFTGTVSLVSVATTTLSSGYIRFNKDNPSGLPEFDNHIDIPVYFVLSSDSL